MPSPSLTSPRDAHGVPGHTSLKGITPDQLRRAGVGGRGALVVHLGGGRAWQGAAPQPTTLARFGQPQPDAHARPPVRVTRFGGGGGGGGVSVCAPRGVAMAKTPGSLFALLTDDAEDATPDSVNTDALTAPTPAAPAKAETDKAAADGGAKTGTAAGGRGGAALRGRGTRCPECFE